MRAWVGTLLLAGACGRVAFDARTDAIAGDDGDSGDVAVDGCTPGPFTTPARLDGPVHSGTDDWSPALAVGETQLFFHSYRAAPNAQIWRATRASMSEDFSAATIEAAITTGTSQQFAPTLTEDGLLLFYAESEAGNFKIHQTSRLTPSANFAASQPVANINAALNAEDNYPFVTGDGLRIVFASTRISGPKTLFETSRPDLASPFGAPVSRSELTEPDSEQFSPSLTRDGLQIYFSSDRAGGLGGYDIYTARRTLVTDPFGPVSHVPELSTADDDVGARISYDGMRMYLNYGAMTTGGNADIFLASRTCR